MNHSPRSVPTDQVLKRAREDDRKSKPPSTQAREFVREEIEHVREGRLDASQQSRRSQSAFRKRAG
jgi:hypothetical protein